MYESDTFHLLNNPKSVGSLSLLPTHTYTHTHTFQMFPEIDLFHSFLVPIYRTHNRLKKLPLRKLRLGFQAEKCR